MTSTMTMTAASGQTYVFDATPYIRLLSRARIALYRCAVAGLAVALGVIGALLI